jgi:hypothetical protein
VVWREGRCMCVGGECGGMLGVGSGRDAVGSVSRGVLRYSVHVFRRKFSMARAEKRCSEV